MTEESAFVKTTSIDKKGESEYAHAKFHQRFFTITRTGKERTMTDFREQYRAAVAAIEKVLRDRLDDPDITGEDCFLIITKTNCRDTALSAVATLLRIENDFEALARYSHHSIFSLTVFRAPMTAGIAQKLSKERKHAPNEDDLTEWAWLVYRQGGGVNKAIFSILRDENREKSDPYLRVLLSLTALMCQHPILGRHNGSVTKETFSMIFIPKLRLEDDPELDVFFRPMNQ